MLSFLPDYIFPSLKELTPAFLHSRGIGLLLLDYDNTMLPYTQDVPTETLLSWLSEMKKAKIQLCIVSNSRKPRVPAFSAAYGVPCVTRAAKPGTRGIREAMKRFGVPKEKTALVGDQIYTDVLGANLAGITAIAVKSINNHTIWLKMRHLLEIPFLAMARKRRVLS